MRFGIQITNYRLKYYLIKYMLFVYKNSGIGVLPPIYSYPPLPPNKKILKTPLLNYDFKICYACIALLHKIIDGMQ